MHNFFNTSIILLYMFRALLCSSSGRQILSVQHLVSSLSLGDCSVHRIREDSLILCTEQLPKESDDTTYQMLHWYNLSSWGWAKYCSKHVEEYNRCIKEVVHQVGNNTTTVIHCNIRALPSCAPLDLSEISIQYILTVSFVHYRTSYSASYEG